MKYDYHKMRERAGLLICIALIGFMLSGCAMFGQKGPITGDPYQAGRLFVFVDTVTEPFQPEEVSAVIDQVYAIANMNLETLDLGDAFVKAQIDQIYADSTPETRETLFNVYKAMVARLEYQIELNPDLPSIAVLDEFNRGIRDALAIYQSKE